MAKRWNVIVYGVGVGFPDPPTLEGDLAQRTKGAMKVIGPTSNFAQGNRNFYTL